MSAKAARSAWPFRLLRELNPLVITSQEKAQVIARAALDVQAEDVYVIDVRALSTITDYFVLCTAGSSRQIDAVADRVDRALSGLGARVVHVEGASRRSSGSSGADPQWVLMDCSDVVVHILDGPARAFYQLERLWGDAPRVTVKSDPPAA